LENFSCQDKIFHGLLRQTLSNPVGSTYIYSDLRSSSLCSFAIIVFITSNLKLHNVDVCCGKSGERQRLHLALGFGARM
jgi:hypothetical protein